MLVLKASEKSSVEQLSFIGLLSFADFHGQHCIIIITYG